MLTCSACGVEHPDGAKFCMGCGAALAPASVIPEERKVVTSLFCDLVGFTSLSESADPEDIDRLLGEYSARARKVIESHGGTVEKFIGDAVVGVFGVPTTHEDDPERAVRAGLRIIEALEGLTRPDGSPLQARVGINTGEALVRLDVTPGSGEGFLRGDAVNVAARLQAAAPPGGVAVGALTHELTSRVIEYEELPPIAAKGKAEPVRAWRALASLARRGIATHAGDLTPLVGREVELSYLSAIFEKAVAQSAPQFVLLIGEPGIGKSRLVRELFNVVDARPQLTTWRQGYCPPFGEDITYWALAEIVKGHAGIRDTDETEAVAAKLEAVLPSGPDREWFRQRLRALLGLDAPEASREENFTAWLRFFEDLAAKRPIVIVFEDLHWADEALLAFLEYLTTHLAAVPLMMVGTARPELLERQPGFASSGAVSRISLGPLSRAETTRLVAGLLGEPGSLATAVDQVVERCEGNPFYAEQSVRLLTDTALEVQLPESVQAVIAARLDTLPADQKALLGDAAVVGTVFWDGAVAAMGALELQELQSLLSGLLERRLIRRIRESSLEGEREFVFVHALAREVAYGRLTRGARARKHAAVAAWLEAIAGTRLEDLAEIVAHHSVTALGLARAAGQGELAESLTDQAVRYLAMAGDRSLQVDIASAARAYGRAAGLLPAEHPGRPLLLQKRAEALFWLGDYRLAADTIGAAVGGFREVGDARAAAAAMTRQFAALSQLGDPTASTVFCEAMAVLEADGPSPELVDGLERLAGHRVISSDYQMAADAAERAIAMAKRLDLPLPIVALHYRGIARCALGDAGGLADLQRALVMAEDRGWAWLVSQIYFNLGDALWLLEGAAAVLAVRRKGLDFAERRGLKGNAQVCRTGLTTDLVLAGEWDEALALSLETEPALEAMGDVPWLMILRSDRAVLHALRGELEAARALAAWIDEQSPGGEDFQALSGATFAQAVVRDAVADGPGARAALSACERLVEDRADADYALRLALAVRVALNADDAALATRLPAPVTPSQPLYRLALASAGALLAEARREHEAAAAGFADAAAGWHDFGVPYEEAQALLGQGRCLLALGRAPEAAQPLCEAHEIFARLGAAPALAETDGWLAKAGPA